MEPAGLRTVVALVLVLLTDAEAFHWTSDIQDGGHLVACVGDNVTFPWAYVTETGENVIAHFWFRNKTGSFASFTNHFTKLSDRVTHGGQAKITLHNVSREDADTYGVSVEILGRKTRPTQRVSLIIAEPPRTIDGQLHVTEDSQSSVHTRYSSQPSTRLKCGHFLSLGFPNVSAVWTDPSGRRLHGTNFHNGYFYLDLDPQNARVGNYTCSLQHEAEATRCMDSDSPLLAAATYRLVTMETALSGLQSQVVVLHNVSKDHDTMISALQEQVSDHSNQILDLQKHDSQQDSQIEDLQRENTSMNSLITDLQKHNRDLQKQTTDQTSQMSDLQKENTDLKSQVSDLQQETRDQNRQISDLQTQNAELQTQLSEQNTAMSSLSTQLASLKKVVSQLQQTQASQVAGLKENMSQLDTQLSGQQDKLSQLDTQLSGQQDKLSQLDTQLSGQQTQLSNHSRQISGLNSRVTSQVEDKGRSLQNDITQCQSDVRGLKTELGNVKALTGQLDKKVAFHAFYDEEAVTEREPIRFELVGQIGGGYDASTGIFTAPHSGWYSFQVQLFPHDSTSQDIWFDLVQNDKIVARGVGYQRASGSFTSFTAITVHVRAGDRIWVRSYYAKPFHRASFDNFFSGVLVMADN